jgi:hypothetical protein
VGDPGVCGAREVGSRTGRSPSQYLQYHPEMSWRDCAFRDLDLVRMGDVGEMGEWRGTRGHVRCPVRAAVAAAAGRAVVEDANDGEVAEEGSRGGVVGELGERSGREE